MYPTTLPRPVREGYQGSYLSPQKGTKMDDDTTRVRRKGASNPLVMTFTWDLSMYQRGIFDGWMRYDNAFGNNWVDLPGPGNTMINVRCLDGAPTYTPQPGGRWKVSGRFMQRMPKFAYPAKGALPVWPSTLPDYESDQYSMSRVDPLILSDINPQSTPESRVRRLNQVGKFQHSVILTPAQREIFIQFYYHTLCGGTFFWRSKVPAALGGFTQVRAQFSGTPVERPYNGIYEVSFEVTTEDLPIINYNDYQEAAGFAPGDINGYSDGYFAEDYVE